MCQFARNLSLYDYRTLSKELEGAFALDFKLEGIITHNNKISETDNDDHSSFCTVLEMKVCVSVTFMRSNIY